MLDGNCRIKPLGEYSGHVNQIIMLIPIAFADNDYQCVLLKNDMWDVSSDH